jgi:hypothetical protein
MLRDPNAPERRARRRRLRLASRFGNSQRANVSAVFDLPMVASDLPDGSIGHDVARFFGPST